MNLKKIVRVAVILVAFVTLGILFKNEISNNKTSAKSELDEIINYYNNIQNKTNNNILKDFLVVNEKKDTLSISHFLTTKKLIYRFSELHCDSCVINEFENLKKFISTQEKEIKDVIMISYYNNIRNLHVFKRINQLQNFEVYNLINNNLGDIELDDMSIPYFFMLDKELKISNTFIPIKQVNKRTDNYLKKMLLKEIK